MDRKRGKGEGRKTKKTATHLTAVDVKRPPPITSSSSSSSSSSNSPPAFFPVVDG